MRMWMVDPRILCRQHLLGEHLEMHMFVGAINKGTNVTGYIKADMLECTSLALRHDDLVKEMQARGYKHKSPIVQPSFETAFSVEQEDWSHEIDADAQLKELLSRCSICRERHASLTNPPPQESNHETERLPAASKGIP